MRKAPKALIFYDYPGKPIKQDNDTQLRRIGTNRHNTDNRIETIVDLGTICAIFRRKVEK